MDHKHRTKNITKYVPLEQFCKNEVVQGTLNIKNREKKTNLLTAVKLSVLSVVYLINE